MDPTTISEAALAVAIGALAVSFWVGFTDDQRWRRERRNADATRPRLSFESASSMSTDESSSAIFATVGLKNDCLILSEVESSREATVFVRVKSLTAEPLPNVILDFEIRYYGGNLPFQASQVEDQASLSIGTLTPNGSKVLALNCPCPFPINIFLKSATTQEQQQIRAYKDLEVVNKWSGYFKGSDTEFRSEDLLEAGPVEAVSLINGSMVKKTEQFFRFRDRVSTAVALLTIERGADNANIIFTHTGYGMSAVNGAAIFIDRFLEMAVVPKDMKRRYYAYFGKPSNNPRKLFELRRDSSSVNVSGMLTDGISKELDRLDDIVETLHREYDLIIQVSRSGV